MTLYLPVGPPASGKSTLALRLAARGLFDTQAIVSPDFFRSVMTGCVTDQSANNAVFKVVDTIVDERLERGLPVWVDATNLAESWWSTYVNAARLHHRDVIFVFMTAPEHVCRQRNQLRPHPVPETVMDAMFERQLNMETGRLPGQVITDRKLLRNTSDHPNDCYPCKGTGLVIGFGSDGGECPADHHTDPDTLLSETCPGYAEG